MIFKSLLFSSNHPKQRLKFFLPHVTALKTIASPFGKLAHVYKWAPKGGCRNREITHQKYIPVISSGNTLTTSLVYMKCSLWIFRAWWQHPLNSWTLVTQVWPKYRKIKKETSNDKHNDLSCRNSTQNGLKTTLSSDKEGQGVEIWHSKQTHQGADQCLSALNILFFFQPLCLHCHCLRP